MLKCAALALSQGIETSKQIGRRSVMDITKCSPVLSARVALKHAGGLHAAVVVTVLAVPGVDGDAWDSVVEHT